eukprot:CAMPEP_0117512406 /NCGR_PEP_ID=MMETSP0784-20121206/29014_1 /TAXON_ID=39447 /ORGANISM="" /LENGTH=286 /DNA_ID=CAMNT_0005308123 /DNA_START=24 /DNA_END=884 /DNA_ORIENTATION=+
MAKEEGLSTDWQRSAGDFSCTVCGRKRLPASEFSKKQVEKALEAHRAIPDKDIRTGPEIQQQIFLSGVCKKCTEEKEQRERDEAQKRREEIGAAVAEAVVDAPERVPVKLATRPFGMTPSKAEGVGYLVARASEGKPAAQAGVRPGWCLAEVAGAPCKGLALEEVQGLLKAAELPVSVVFDAVPAGADFCIACERVLPAPAFSRKMRTKPPTKRRCSACVEAAGEAEAEAETETAAAGEGPTSKLAELRALCADSAEQAEKVTGLKAVRGGSYGGRGRGGRGSGRR